VVQLLHYYFVVPKIRIFGDCAIIINPRDHLPPHFHVVFRDGQRCSIAIDSMQIIAGSVTPARRLAAAQEWARQNREILHARWKEIHQ